MGTLTERVLRFQETGQGQAELLACVAARVYGYPRVRGSRSEDDSGEFYLFFYPRLLRSLRRFRDQGKPFEWYLQSVLRWQYLIYVRVKRRRERQWNAGALPAFWETRSWRRRSRFRSRLHRAGARSENWPGGWSWTRRAGSPGPATAPGCSPGP